MSHPQHRLLYHALQVCLYKENIEYFIDKPAYNMARSLDNLKNARPIEDVRVCVCVYVCVCRWTTHRKHTKCWVDLNANQ